MATMEMLISYVLLDKSFAFAVLDFISCVKHYNNTTLKPHKTHIKPHDLGYTEYKAMRNKYFINMTSPSITNIQY